MAENFIISSCVFMTEWSLNIDCPVCCTYSTIHTEFRAIYYYFHYWYMQTQLTPLLQKHKVNITGGLFNNYTIKMRSLLQKVLNSQKFTAYTIQGRGYY